MCFRRKTSFLAAQTTPGDRGCEALACYFSGVLACPPTMLLSRCDSGVFLVPPVQPLAACACEVLLAPLAACACEVPLAPLAACACEVFLAPLAACACQVFLAPLAACACEVFLAPFAACACEVFLAPLAACACEVFLAPLAACACEVFLAPLAACACEVCLAPLAACACAVLRLAMDDDCTPRFARLFNRFMSVCRMLAWRRRMVGGAIWGCCAMKSPTSKSTSASGHYCNSCSQRLDMEGMKATRLRVHVYSKSNREEQSTQ